MAAAAKGAPQRMACMASIEVLRQAGYKELIKVISHQKLLMTGVLTCFSLLANPCAIDRSAPQSNAIPHRYVCYCIRYSKGQIGPSDAQRQKGFLEKPFKIKHLANLKMVGTERFELSTYGLRVRCSTS